MRTNVYNTRNEAREERKRLRVEAGLLSDRFPDVARIVVTMRYKGKRSSSLLRTLNFHPGSHAFFRVSCLGEGCDGGGLDLTQVIYRMVRGHEKSMKGDLCCESKSQGIAHADVDYNVSITYA